MRIHHHVSIILFVAIAGAIGLAVTVGILLGGLERTARSVGTATEQYRQVQTVVVSGRVPFSFFPPVQADYIAAQLTMPQGTPVDVTRRGVEQLQEAALELREEIVLEQYRANGGGEKRAPETQHEPQENRLEGENHGRHRGDKRREDRGARTSCAYDE